MEFLVKKYSAIRKKIFTSDGVLLVFTALILSLFILKFGLPLYESIIFDLRLKDKGYIYTYQNFIAAVLAFIAATFAYRYSIYDKEQRSYNVALHVASMTAVHCGQIRALREHMMQGLSFNSEYLQRTKNDLCASVQRLQKIDSYALKPKIALHLNILKDNLDSIIDTLNVLSEIDENNDNYTLHKNFLISSCEHFDHQYKLIQDYSSKYFNKYI